MTWATRFRADQYLRESLWFVPLLGALAGGLGSVLVLHVGHQIHLPSQWQYSPTTASTVLSATIGAMAALAGFVVTVTVLVVQMATSTFSARYMRLFYRDRVLKFALALLIGTLTFSFGLLRQIEAQSVPDLGVTIAGVMVATSLVMFLIFFNRFLHRLRPVAVASFAAGQMRRSLRDNVLKRDDEAELFAWPLEGIDEQPALSIRCNRPGSIQAIHLSGLLTWSRENDCLVVMEHSIGDFLQVGDVLFEVYGSPEDTAAVGRRLRGYIALGIERTIEQDPTFAIRVMVDVAVKALSSAINDPTTAVQVLDHLDDSLRLVGNADTARPSWKRGAARRGVVLPFRRWEDVLSLGVTEIREYGSSSIQVMRRMRALLEGLSEQVRQENRAQVHREMTRLDATVARAFSGSIDLDRAGIADRQGLGGPGRLESTSPVPGHRETPPAH